jgi:hypothetical protein
MTFIPKSKKPAAVEVSLALTAGAFFSRKTQLVITQAVGGMQHSVAGWRGYFLFFLWTSLLNSSPHSTVDSYCGMTERTHGTGHSPPAQRHHKYCCESFSGLSPA